MESSRVLFCLNLMDPPKVLEGKRIWACSGEYNHSSEGPAFECMQVS